MGLPKQVKDHTKTQVEVIPNCDLPHDEPVLAYADARMVRNAGRWNGSWANQCKEHFDEHGCELGLGRGQEFVQISLDAGRPDNWEPGQRPCEENDWACQYCGKPGGH